jgi:hypothetical protein
MKAERRKPPGVWDTRPNSLRTPNQLGPITLWFLSDAMIVAISAPVTGLLAQLR